MKNSIIHYIGIAVSDPARSEPFFDSLLVDYLSMEKEIVWESKGGWKGRGSRIYLYERKNMEEGHSLQHLAFTARCPEEVAKFPGWAEERGIVVSGPPKAYPEYGKDYFAVFFQGPDQLRFELVFLSEADGEGAL